MSHFNQPFANRRKTKSPVRLLHVAAFGGNLGDKLNHNSFYHWFESHFAGRELIWTRIDLRQVWRGDRDLEKAIRQVHPKPDVIVIGGGNFWETWDKSSESGTSINMTADRFVDLGIPVFFNSLGAEIARGISPNAREIFSKDLQVFTSSEQFFTTIRNDGSRDNLRQLRFDSSDLLTLPDHGFFPVINSKRKERDDCYNVVLNIAQDMEEIRYRGFPSKKLFVSGLAEVLVRIASNRETRFQIVAHVPSDIEIGSQLISLLPESLQRESVSISFNNSPNPSDLSFVQPYLDADLVIAQRFHSTILGLLYSENVISISNHPQLVDMLHEVEAREGTSVPIENAGDFGNLIESMDTGMQTDKPISDKYNSQKILCQRLEVSRSLGKWLSKILQ